MNFLFLSNLGLEYLNNGFTTIELVSKFYDVSIDTIKTIIKRNRDIFVDIGYKTIEKDELQRVISENPDKKISRRCRCLAVLNNKCVIYLAYLQSSTKLTCEIIDINMKLNYKLHNAILNRYSSTSFEKKYEKELSFLVHSIFDEFHKIDEQVCCEKYKIDFVIDDYLAIECDEDGHSNYNQQEEIKREKCIISNGYKILRYDTRENNMLKFIGQISNCLCK